MPESIETFRKKFNKEMKTGLLSMLLLYIIDQSTEPCYGYRIIRTLDEVTGGEFKLPEGTVYPILNSLRNKELLHSYWGDSPDGPRRKYYTITKQGKDALDVCLKDWKAMSLKIDSVLEAKED